MSEKDLKKKLIKLAFETPEIREALMPLIKESAVSPAERKIADDLDRYGGNCSVIQNILSQAEKAMRAGNVKKADEDFQRAVKQVEATAKSMKKYEKKISKLAE